ncbi:class I SAM-dependent methyltransferase [Pendulispora albinea]|uniref:S-adenosyl-L-methionine-dependent methyltransferase n=1 Tax=Pendulispora albinea TaxID=2741071 RepID=A0ABZ2LW60_9BACT
MDASPDSLAPPAGEELSASAEGAPLGDVSDTARWVAYFRALESERRDALFRDPHARRLAGERGRAIAMRLRKGPLAWSLAVRTRVFDELIVDAVRTKGVRTVVNLGAGLDTRPYRLALPSNLRWIEVELPDLLQFKQDALAGERSVCAVERVPLDLGDRAARNALFEGIGRSDPRAYLVTEGLLVYLDEMEVASLAGDLARAFPDGSWLLENVAPFVLARQRRRWNEPLRAARAEMKFAPAEGLAFFARHGWAPRTTKSLLDEAERLGREMPFARLSRFLFTLFPSHYEKVLGAVVHAVMEPRSPEDP